MKTPLWICLAGLCVIGACSHPSPQPQDDRGPIDARRVALPVADPVPANTTGANKNGADKDIPAQWSMTGDTARFGVADADPLLTLACKAGRLVITRPIAAEVGAGVLFAIEGPKRIVRIPLDATPVPGQRGYVWQGSMDGADASTDVFESAFTGTLPGGGLIKVTPGQAPRDVVHRCAHR